MCIMLQILEQINIKFEAVYFIITKTCVRNIECDKFISEKLNTGKFT